MTIPSNLLPPQHVINTALRAAREGVAMPVATSRPVVPRQLSQAQLDGLRKGWKRRREMRKNKQPTRPKQTAEQVAHARLAKLKMATLQKKGYTLMEIAGLKGLDVANVKQALYYDKVR